MQAKTVIIATCETYPHPSPSLALLMASLAQAGVTARFLPWATTPIDAFAGADLVLPLCCWDSHHDPIAFTQWLDALEQNQTPLLNDKQTLLWNLDKTYLIDLMAKGVAVPPSQYLAQVSHQSILACMQHSGWSSAVIKPIYGEGGDGVALLHAAKPDDWNVSHWLQRGALLQEFQRDISHLNETTLFFIDRDFSHAVRRVLPDHEWRANLQYGMTLIRVDVDESTIQQARSFLDYAPAMPLYARVDGILRPEGLILMELELIDPYPHLEFCEGSSDAFARAILRRL